MKTDYGQTVGGLTINQLLTAAHDLRNAALVVKHSGHFQGALVDKATGMVCLAGAIDLATYRRMHYNPVNGSYTNWPQDAYSEAGAYRAEAAILVLSEVVVRDLCPECSDTERAEPCHRVYCECQPREPWEIVTHYNDTHCVGGTLAVNVLRMAADHADMRAEVKRQANADMRVTV